MEKKIFASIVVLSLLLLAGCTGDEDLVCVGDACALPDAVPVAEKTVVLVSFWGDGCPHCAAEKVFLDEMQAKYPGLDVVYIETWKDQGNQELFQRMARAYGITARGVPTSFLGDLEPIVGFSEQMESDLEERIKTCILDGCPDPHLKLNGTDST